jgi:hypothetical protein
MSNLPSDTPRLPKWIFLVSDAVLIAAAWFITTNNTGHLVGWPLLAVFGLFVIGVALAVIPYLADYVREQVEALHERQNALEALSRTVATSAEQISIAANGLHELLELSHRNLKQAEQLPHKLQEKIAEFQQLLATANDEEKEELERELATLRGSDSERLESTADKVHKSAADWAKLETATAKHLAAANEALAKLADTAEAGVGKLTQAAETAVAKASAEIAKALASAYTGGAGAIDNKLAASLAEIDAKLAKGAGQLTVRATDAATLFDAKLAALETAIARLESGAAKAGTEAIAPAATAAEKPAATETAEPTTSEPATTTPADAPPPKRARKPRREEPAAEVAADETVAADASKPDATAEATPIAPPAAAVVPSPEAMVAPAPLANAETTPPPADENPQSAIANPQSEEPKPARKRAAKKATEPEPPPPEIATEEPAAPPVSNEFSQEPPEEARATSAVSADGATRLLVTAYVGIGNRLFVRGVGPGLNQDKGVPLQFVSIGKWRWETADATAPIRVKLYKNDLVECSMLGEIALEPGHQAEVTANF